eukprot:TRINITY_DN12062_c0_g1_i1.p1 TRINITY_DN12062_c0_g1~~TRINITY_DN12062_c0_g1_i1.p1  ORF type:complete len:158 (-),score=3.69 TRINITY_DN12062_c0_g1_i1:178-651(-)
MDTTMNPSHEWWKQRCRVEKRSHSSRPSTAGTYSRFNFGDVGSGAVAAQNHLLLTGPLSARITSGGFQDTVASSTASPRPLDFLRSTQRGAGTPGAGPRRKLASEFGTAGLATFTRPGGGHAPVVDMLGPSEVRGRASRQPRVLQDHTGAVIWDSST